jgi:REP element-mobilizing transposase RayT
MYPERNTPAGGLFFLTLCIQDRQPWLAVPRTREVLLAVLRTWHMERNGRILAAMAMPDRVHVLLELAGNITAAQVVANWKAALRRGAGYPETFERDFVGHRLRETEKAEDYGLYLFLCPYRAGLIPAEEKWPGWWLPEAAVFQFPAALSPEGLPPAEWIAWPDDKFAGLTVGQ